MGSLGTVGSRRESLRVFELVNPRQRRSALLRVAIFHDFLSSLGGGEKLILTMAREFDADVITNDFNPDILRLAGSQGVRIIDLGPLFKAAPLRQIHASLRFMGARFRGYDLYVFSGNWCHYGAKRHKPSLMYCHTPVRAFYDQRESMLNRLPPWQRPLAMLWVAVHSKLDTTSVKHMDFIAVNSENTRGRVRRYYGRDSTVVFPPIAIDSYHFDSIGDFWLSVNRFYPEKRIEMQVEIFRRLPSEKLYIVGDTQSEETPRRIAASLDLPHNVRLLGAVDQERLADLYAKCKGFIATAVDEDFGMTPVEAMASGKVVVATNEGGYRESVVDGETGWLLPADVDAFVQKISSLTPRDLETMKEKCASRAAEFGERAFIQKLRTLIKSMEIRGLP